MSAKVVVPELGESVLEATVGRWFKNEGDPVGVGEVLVSLETDKVDLEVGAERGGVLVKIERHEGEDVKIGDVLGVIEEAGATARPDQATADVAPRAPRESTVPSTADAVGGLSTAHVPATAEAASTPASGGLAETPKTANPPASAAASSERPATPSARRLAREQGVDLTAVSPSNGGARVTKRDVAGYLERGAPSPSAVQAPPAPPKGAPAAPKAAPDQAETHLPDQLGTGRPSSERTEQRVRMSRRRQTIARRLVEAQHAAAMLTTFNEVDMSAVMELRKRHKESFQDRYGVSLGISSFFVKSTVAALREFPLLNAEIDGDEIIFKRYFDIGIAVGAAEGLVVPVLRDAGHLSFAAIEKGIKRFAQQARDRTLSLDDLRGGTFTITNGGVFGSLMSTPILNPPQVGILGLHKVLERPVTVGGQIVSRPMMYVALSYDHRIVDGLEAVQFLVRIKQLIEDPASLLLEG